MEARRVLPSFQLGGFMQNVGKGLSEKERADISARNEKQRLAEEKQKAIEMVQAEKRRERHEKTEFWTTPGLRPLAEPLILDWDWFFRERIPSDARYKALFPSSPSSRSRMKDLVGEVEALTEYTGWALMMKDDPDTEADWDIRDERRRRFYSSLHQSLNIDKEEVWDEMTGMLATATELGTWEYRYLDSDGVGTTRIEEFVGKRADIFRDWGDEVRAKYGHLLPSNFVENPVSTFEFEWCDRDGGVTYIKGQLRQGDDIFLKWHQKAVIRKYGHLRVLLPRWARGSHYNLLRYGMLSIRDKDIYYDEEGAACVRTEEGLDFS